MCLGRLCLYFYMGNVGRLRSSIEGVKRPWIRGEGRICEERRELRNLCPLLHVSIHFLYGVVIAFISNPSTILKTLSICSKMGHNDLQKISTCGREI